MKNANKVAIAAAVGVGALIVLGATSCVSIPEGAAAVSPFDSEKYLGKWYEIARLDFKYERNLTNVTATYTLNENGSIRVDNRGFDTTKNDWKQSIGKAKFVKGKNVGRLKVSFFGPFYSGYNVIAIDPEYKYALVMGDNLKYMWLLSREKDMPQAVKADYLAKAKVVGYDTEALVWTRHDKE
ncbi:apolipoprotein D and lipocalin family protein [Filimonas zeae]|uniref:Outer membrane lipoprotein Blc n=1 Tax=Filimonas zeae TaxID=1737353 RepID=A0A917J1L2_9BACT|nr:lipocalin family protein [Filimonas zeae]MDR6340607.1 apolipoprotein D and lipocalin family protein [Filimonas zeae]GGH73526.1 membrane protein [Filimonas zeae]